MFDEAALSTAVPAGTVVSGEEITVAMEGGEAPAEAAAQPAAPAAPAQPDLSATVEALQRQVQELTARASQPASTPLDHHQLANALVAAENARAAEYARIQAQRADLQPPTFSEDDKAALVADPDAVLRAIDRKVMHGVKSVLAQIAPDLWKAQAAYEWSATHNDVAADWALNKAREMAENSGITAEEFKTLGDDIYALLWQSAQQAPNREMHFVKVTQNPQALYAAATIARSQRGGGPVIVDKKQPAPTVGAGAHREQNPQPRAAPVSLSRFEAAVGRKPTPADMKRLQEAVKSYASAFPSAV